MSEKKPKLHKVELRVEKDRGIGPLLATLLPPEGYALLRAERRGTKATFTYIAKDAS